MFQICIAFLCLAKSVQLASTANVNNAINGTNLNIEKWKQARGRIEAAVRNMSTSSGDRSIGGGQEDGISAVITKGCKEISDGDEKSCPKFHACCNFECHYFHLRSQSQCINEGFSPRCQCLTAKGAGPQPPPRDRSTERPNTRPTDGEITPLCGRPKIQPSLDDSRIIGGSEAIPHSWPWQVSIRCKLDGTKCKLASPDAKWDHRCGGSLLDEYHVLTAAHCFYNRDGTLLDKSEFRVIFGLHERQSSNRVSRNIDQVWLNLSFKKSSKTHDVAIIRLSQPITYSDYIMPVCLPQVDVPAGTNCVTTGWGYTNENGTSVADLSPTLHQVQVPIISTAVCNNSDNELINGHIDSTMICAGKTNKDACQGDSGGPLVCLNSKGTWEQQGITSWGIGCGHPYGGVYTKVTSVLDWIKSNQSVVKCGQRSLMTGITTNERKINGLEALPHSWPWQISLQRYNYTSSGWDHICGGSIITENFILTAAHCLLREHQPKNYRVLLGLHNRLKPERDVVIMTVTEIILHPKFVYGSYDTALIRLSKPVKFTDKISPICLPDEEFPSGSECIATGWGVKQANSTLSDVLLQVSLKKIARNVCSDAVHYGNILKIDQSMICAGGTHGDTCGGDSGGPLVYQRGQYWELQGIISGGIGCNDPSKPGIYVRVSQIVEWIQSIIGS